MYSDKPLALRPLPEQATFLGIIVGMAKDAGYSRDRFISAVKLAWPHVKVPPSTGNTNLGDNDGK